MPAPLNPPKSWFEHPGVIPTDKRVAITADGRVYGYVALWDTCHVGLPGCTKPPKGSPTNYAYAHTGETVTEEGEIIATANIGGGAGHAFTDDAAPNEFYDNTSSQLMRVRYGEDDNGLWFAGALWPDVNDLEVARIRASAISGDWRWFGSWRKTRDGGYDFAGSCLVNIPGYPMRDPGSITQKPGYMTQIAASIDSRNPVNFYSVDGVVMSDVENDCGCTDEQKQTCTECGQEVEPAVTAAADADASNMKLDEILSRLARLEEALANIEVEKLAEKVIE